MVRHAGGVARPAAPVSKANLQPCSGQTTVVPETMPSHSGRPLCGHSFSMVRKRSFRLKIAISRPPTRIGLPSRAGIFSVRVMRVHLGSAIMRIRSPLARSERIAWHAPALRVRAMHLWKEPWIFADDPAFFAAQIGRAHV